MTFAHPPLYDSVLLGCKRKEIWIFCILLLSAVHESILSFVHSKLCFIHLQKYKSDCLLLYLVFSVCVHTLMQGGSSWLMFCRMTWLLFYEIECTIQYEIWRKGGKAKTHNCLEGLCILSPSLTFHSPLPKVIFWLFYHKKAPSELCASNSGHSPIFIVGAMK